jgi:hypothetical protein
VVGTVGPDVNPFGGLRMNAGHGTQLGLRAGDWVEVKSKEEILGTLDARGMVDEMPFMPEMLQYCGKRLRVSKRAHKTCDPAIGVEGRKLDSAVHLENIRCDGGAHDGCDAACLIFWKEAWLRRAESSTDNDQGLSSFGSARNNAPTFTEDALIASVKTPPAQGETEPTYMCQNTQVKFATRTLPWWDLRQYAEDYFSGNVRASGLAAGLAYTIWRTAAEAGIGLGSAMRWTYDVFQRAIGGSPYPLRPYGVPEGAKEPKALLDLQVGELVRVKPHAEILKTLDSRYRNRGLYFDTDYVPFTEREFRVARRVKQIIDERDGKMVRFKSDAIVLENVYCEGRFAVCRRFCPRAIVPYWREIWLERAPHDSLKRD